MQRFGLNRHRRDRTIAAHDAPLPPGAGVSISADARPLPAWLRTFSALQNPHFRILFVGMIASFVAMQMNIVANGYLGYQLGGAVALGIVSMSRGAPMLVFSLIGGAVADRTDKRSLLFRTQTGLGLTAAIAAVLVAMDAIQLWHMVIIGFAEGTIFAFNMPARQAMLPEIVGRGQISNAIALNNAGMNFTRILGPTVAGMLIGLPFIGLAGVYAVIAACYGIIIVTLFFLPSGGPAGTAFGSMWYEIGLGFRHILDRPLLATLLVMAVVPILVGLPYQTLLPVFQARVLHVDASGLGLLYAASGVGALAGSLLVAYLADSPKKPIMQLVSGVVFGVSLSAFALSGAFYVSLLLLTVVGLSGNMYMALNTSLVMLNTDDAYYGRVMSVYMMTWSLMPLSALPLSAVVEAVGAPLTVAAAGAVVALFIGGAAVLRPGLLSPRAAAPTEV